MDHSLFSSPGNFAQSVSLQITGVTGTQIIVAYYGISGNMPSDYNNSIVVFSGLLFPYSSSNQLLENYHLADNTSSGTVTIPVKTEGAFSLGYSLGPTLPTPAQPFGNVCSTVASSIGSTIQNPQQAALSVTYVSPTIISTVYQFGEGLTPNTNGAWVGLWKGRISLYNNPPVVAQPITQDASTGKVTINVTVLRGVTYTLGLFTSGFAQQAQTTLAATCMFST